MVPSSRIRRGGAKLSVCPQPAIRSYFEQFGSEQASKTTVFRHNFSNCESAFNVFGPILGRQTYLIIWQTTGVRSDHQVSKVRQTTFSFVKYRSTREPQHYIVKQSLLMKKIKVSQRTFQFKEQLNLQYKLTIMFFHVFYVFH